MPDKNSDAVYQLMQWLKSMHEGDPPEPGIRVPRSVIIVVLICLAFGLLEMAFPSLFGPWFHHIGWPVVAVILNWVPGNPVLEAGVAAGARLYGLSLHA